MTALVDAGGWTAVLRRLADGDDIGAEVAGALFGEKPRRDSTRHIVATDGTARRRRR